MTRSSTGAPATAWSAPWRRRRPLRSVMRRSPPWCWRNSAAWPAPVDERPLCSARCRRRAAPSSSSPAARARIRRWRKCSSPAATTLLAIEAGERAMMLNPYDPSILADLGVNLVAVGEHERGMRLLREAAAVNVVRPARQDFFLFLAAYLAGDPAGAARYAALMTSDTYPLGLMARALVAARRGDADHARASAGAPRRRLSGLARGQPQRAEEVFFRRADRGAHFPRSRADRQRARSLISIYVEFTGCGISACVSAPSVPAWAGD